MLVVGRLLLLVHLGRVVVEGRRAHGLGAVGRGVGVLLAARVVRVGVVRVVVVVQLLLLLRLLLVGDPC